MRRRFVQARSFASREPANRTGFSAWGKRGMLARMHDSKFRKVASREDMSEEAAGIGSEEWFSRNCRAADFRRISFSRMNVCGGITIHRMRILWNSVVKLETQHRNPITQFHPSTRQIHQNSQAVAQLPPLAKGRGAREIRELSFSLSLSLCLCCRKVATVGEQTIPKSLRAIHVLATPWQPGGKHLNPPAHSSFPQKERTHRASTFSLRHCRPSFLPMPAGCTRNDGTGRKRVAAPSRK